MVIRLKFYVKEEDEEEKDYLLTVHHMFWQIHANAFFALQVHQHFRTVKSLQIHTVKLSYETY